MLCDTCNFLTDKTGLYFIYPHYWFIYHKSPSCKCYWKRQRCCKVDIDASAQKYVNRVIFEALLTEFQNTKLCVVFCRIVILFQHHTNKFYLTLKLNQVQSQVQYRRQFSYTAAPLYMSSFLSIDLTEMRPLAVIILAWWFLNYVNWSLWLCFNCSTMIYVFHVLFVSQQ